MLKVDTGRMEAQALKMLQIADQLKDVASRVAAADRKLSWQNSISSRVRSDLRAYDRAISGLDDKASRLGNALSDSARLYAQAERAAQPGAKTDANDPSRHGGGGRSFDPSKHGGGGRSLDDDDGVRDLSKGTWTVMDVVIDGFINKTKGRPSTAKSWSTRFKNNIKNKTSAFNYKNAFKDTFDDFVGKNGGKKAAASWGAAIVNGVFNFLDNKDEQKGSGGKMSDERVWNETVTETAVGIVLQTGAKVAVGAAITAVTGVTAPAVAVAAGATLLVMGVDAIVEKCTGESLTEHVSDFIVDTGEAVAKAAKKAVGNAAKNAKKAVGKWFKKLKFA